MTHISRELREYCRKYGIMQSPLNWCVLEYKIVFEIGLGQLVTHKQALPHRGITDEAIDIDSIVVSDKDRYTYDTLC